jgi:CheY-like chemotaxis protein
LASCLFHDGGTTIADGTNALQFASRSGSIMRSVPHSMPVRHKILLLDDEEDLLDMYRELFTHLPSKPEIRTCNSGARAISLLESEPFSLLISDLNMPKMDGLQVLSIVRRKFPELRIVVLTAVMDEQFRSRAYAMGVDLFWQKPATAQELQLFQDCIESLLDREDKGGFRGVQSKSLVDIIQLECLSQSSLVLRIKNKGVEGRIWINNGEVIDATTGQLSGEAAFKEIFSWKTGSFESLAAEPDRPRTITSSYQGLLLDTAQSIDEAQSAPEQNGEANGTPASPLIPLTKFKGVEFVVSFGLKDKSEAGTQTWGTEDPKRIADWGRHVFRSLETMGQKVHAGDFQEFIGSGPEYHVGLLQHGEQVLCAGFKRSLTPEQVKETLNQMRRKWAS